jgi:hypothetical protein
VFALSLPLAIALGAASCAPAPLRPEPPHAASVATRASASAPAGGPTSEHPIAIAHLAASPWGARLDKRAVLAVPLPDASEWTHVRFWGVTTLAGWRYGDDHHAVAAAFTFAPKTVPATIDECAERFADWGRPRARSFDLRLSEPRVDEIPWQGKRARVYVMDADRRSIFATHRYFAAYAVLPAWRDACLVVGFAVPGADAVDDARTVRDRWVRDAVEAISTKADAGSRALEQRTFD